jgi:hypothetical protein
VKIAVKNVRNTKAWSIARNVPMRAGDVPKNAGAWLPELAGFYNLIMRCYNLQHGVLKKLSFFLLHGIYIKFLYQHHYHKY